MLVRAFNLSPLTKRVFPRQNVLYTPFNRFIVEFLDIEPSAEDGINFGEWLHCVSTICLFEREEMVLLLAWLVIIVGSSLSRNGVALGVVAPGPFCVRLCGHATTAVC